MTTEPSAWGVAFFFLILLIGIACVSVHYRRKYEELKIAFNKIAEDRRRLKHIVSADVQQFSLPCSRREFIERTDYIKNCIIKYRAKTK